MQLTKSFLVLMPIAFTVLTIADRSNRSATAHFDRPHSHQNVRVGFNQQMVYSLGATNRAQQAHYFEQAKFANRLKELNEAGFVIPDNDNYKLKIESGNSAAFIYGIPQQKYGTYKEWSGIRWKDTEEPLYAYVSAIAYLKDSSSFESILCVSKTIGKQKLAKPKIAESNFTCSQDTEEIP